MFYFIGLLALHLLFENFEYQQRKRLSKTVIESLNCLNKEISLSNYRYCVCCKQHLLESSAIELTNDDATFEETEHPQLDLKGTYINQTCSNTDLTHDGNRDDSLVRMESYSLVEDIQNEKDSHSPLEKTSKRAFPIPWRIFRVSTILSRKNHQILF